MQYRQATRIIVEIATDPEAKTATVLAAASLLLLNLPRLGRYKPRSAARILWRVASNPRNRPEDRLTALKKLLAFHRLQRKKAEEKPSSPRT